MSRNLPLFLLTLLIPLGACDGVEVSMGELELASVQVTFVSGHLGRDCGESRSSSGIGLSDAASCPDDQECPIYTGCESGMLVLELSNPNTTAIEGIEVGSLRLVADGGTLPDTDRVVAVNDELSIGPFDGRLEAEETLRILILFRGPNDEELPAGDVARAIVRIIIGGEEAGLETPDLIFVPNVAT